MKLKSLLLTALAVLTLSSCSEEDHPEIILPSVPYALIPGIGGKVDVGLNCKGDWLITTGKDSWVTVSPKNGTGNATVTFTAEENTTNSERKEYVNINSQQFLVVQTMDVKIDNVVGEWATEKKDYIFTFREDKTCEAKMERGNFTGTYIVTGNIIKIAVTGMPKSIDVVVNELDKTTMKASVSGTELQLNKVVEEVE